MTPHARNQLRADLALLGISLIWGTTFTLVKEALEDGTPWVFLSLRFLTATVALFPFALRGSRWPWKEGAALGIVLAVGYLAQTIGLSTIEPGRSAFLTGVSVVLVPLLGGLFLWERLGRWDVIGALLAWAGLASLTGWILHPGDRLAGGDAWTLACALAFAFHILWVGRFTHKHPTIRLTWIQIAVATVVLVVGTGVVEPDSVSEILGRGSGGLLRMSPAFLGIVAFTGVFATALTLILQIRMQRLTTASHTAVIFATEPVFAALLSYAVRSERPRPEEIVGAVMILSGILVVQLSRSRDESRLPAIQA